MLVKSIVQGLLAGEIHCPSQVVNSLTAECGKDTAYALYYDALDSILDDQNLIDTLKEARCKKPFVILI